MTRRRHSLSRIFARATPDPETGCLLLPVDGYATVRVDGRSDRAHRLAWRLYHRRRVPTGRLVTHSCDRRPCIARAHLRLGTYLSNAREAAERGRMRRGEANPAAKLRDADVVAMRARARAGAARIPELAAEHGMSQSAIRSILRGSAWRHLLEVA